MVLVLALWKRKEVRGVGGDGMEMVRVPPMESGGGIWCLCNLISSMLFYSMFHSIDAERCLLHFTGGDGSWKEYHMSV